MHILFLTENFPPEMNAAATRVYERACYWIRWGHEVTVVTSAPNFPRGTLFEGYKNRWYQVEVKDGIRVVRVKTFISPNEGFLRRTLDFLSFMIMGFVGGILQTKSDVVVSTSPQFFTAVAGWAVSVIRRLPFVFELGDLWPSNLKALGVMREGFILNMLEDLEIFLYQRAAAVVALTEAFKENLVCRGIPAKKISVVINGVDLPRYGPRSRNEELARKWNLSEKIVIGYIGTHGLAHGLENVLHAADQLRDREEIRFIFVGTGAARKALVEESKQLLLPNVVFIPPQPKANILLYWSLCDIALIHLKDHPDFATVIPSKMFEAMGMGLAQILVAPAGEAKRILDESGAGIWVPANKPDALARAVLDLYGNPDIRKRYAHLSLASAPRYSRERQARDMLTELRSVVDR